MPNSLFRFISITFSSSNDNPIKWNALIFSQQWPITSCIDHLIKNPDGFCNLFLNMTSWTVHGLWLVFVLHEGFYLAIWGVVILLNFCQRDVYFVEINLCKNYFSISCHWISVLSFLCGLLPMAISSWSGSVKILTECIRLQIPSHSSAQYIWVF